MALTVTNNVSSLIGQNNLTRTSSMLSKSLERLSSGLKINRGADGPAALVISEQQRAQIAGLNQAIENAGKAVSMVQTAEGALNEINRLLVKARSLALDSANAGVNDADAQAANQAEITNLLDTIDRIANNTQFGTKRLLNGAAQQNALATTETGVSVTGTLTTTPSINSYTYTVSQAAVKADVTGTSGFAGTGGTIGTGKGGSFTINGVSVTLQDNDTVATAVTKINNVLTNNGVNVQASNAGGQLRLTATDFTTDIDIRDGTGLTGALSTRDIGLTSTNADVYGSGATIPGGGLLVADDGKQFKINTVDITLNTGDTLADVADSINAVTGTTNVRASIQGGQLRLIATDNTTSIVIADGTTTGGLPLAGLTAGTTAPTATVDHTDGQLSFIDSTGSSVSVTGTGNSFTLSGELTGATVTLAADQSNTLNSVAPSNATFAVGQKLVFQIGPNASQTASLSIASVKTEALGVGAATGVSSLAAIDLSTADSAQSAISVIDQAIAEVTTKRGDLGAFQANTLEATANNLRATLENTVNAESIIRDTDFASEVANMTKFQTLLQTGISVLSNANQTPQLVLSLLRG